MEMVTTPMAMGTMVETRETTPMVITMEIVAIRMETMVTTMEAMVTTMEAMVTTMEAMGITTETMGIRMEEMGNTLRSREPIGISLISLISSAGRLDTLQMIALRISQMKMPSPIHSTRDM
jgi:hypothetical protein